MNIKEISRHPYKNSALALGVTAFLYSVGSFYYSVRQDNELHNQYEATPEGQQVNKLKVNKVMLNQARLYLCPRITGIFGEDMDIFKANCSPATAIYIKNDTALFLNPEEIQEDSKEIEKLPNINAAVNKMEKTIFDIKEIDPDAAKQLGKTAQKIKDLPANLDDIDSKFQLANSQIILSRIAGKLRDKAYSTYNNPVSQSGQEIYKKMEESGQTTFKSVLGAALSLGLMTIGLSSRKKTTA